MRLINGTFLGVICLYAIFLLFTSSHLAFWYISGYNYKKTLFFTCFVKEINYGKLDFFNISQ